MTPHSAEKIGRFRNHVRDMQQGFGRNASAQQTGAAQLGLRLNQCDLEPSIGREKRGGVSTRTATEDNKLRVHGVCEMVFFGKFAALSRQELDHHIGVHWQADIALAR